MKLKSVTVEQLALETGRIVNEARKRPVVVHAPGKQTLILRSLADDDDVVDELLMKSPSFRASIRAARRNMAAGKGIPLAEARRRLKA
jgi:hypothetical protein